MQITSPRREAAIRLFSRVERGEMTITAAAAEVGVKRQTASEWFAKWKKAVAYADENPSPDTTALKGLPASADPAPVHEVPARESAQPAPLTMAERRANARVLILDDLRLGVHRKFAAARAGIARATFYAWLADPEWLAEVEAAEADFAHRVNAVMNDEMQNGRPGQRWLPAMTAAERRFPEAFGRRSNVAVDVEVRGSLDVRRVVADPALIDKMTELEMLYQRQELAAPVIEGEALPSLPEHGEVGE